MGRIAALLVILGLGWVGYVTLVPEAQSPMLIENPIAQVMAEGDEAGAHVVFTLSNPGGPDALISASSDAADVEIVRPAGLTRTVIPAGASPGFSRDGVYLRLTDFDPAPVEGDLIPIELGFAQSGSLAFKARVEASETAAMDHNMMDHNLMEHGEMDHAAMGHGDGATDAAPTLTLTLAPDGEGWRVTLETTGFTFFRPDGADMAPEVDGEGHAHLYLDGLKIGRMYGPETRIGALLPGSYTVSAGLNSNMHRPLLSSGRPITAEATLTVE